VSEEIIKPLLTSRWGCGSLIWERIHLKKQRILQRKMSLPTDAGVGRLGQKSQWLAWLSPEGRAAACDLGSGCWLCHSMPVWNPNRPSSRVQGQLSMSSDGSMPLPLTGDGSMPLLDWAGGYSVFSPNLRVGRGPPNPPCSSPHGYWCYQTKPKWTV
jgi:hypothetical protein